MTQKIGRYSEGSQHDYPFAVWRQIEKDAKMPLDKFSVAVENNELLQSSLKGRPQVHKRLGATQ